MITPISLSNTQTPPPTYAELTSQTAPEVILRPPVPEQTKLETKTTKYKNKNKKEKEGSDVITPVDEKPLETPTEKDVGTLGPDLTGPVVWHLYRKWLFDTSTPLERKHFLKTKDGSRLLELGTKETLIRWHYATRIDTPAAGGTRSGGSYPTIAAMSYRHPYNIRHTNMTQGIYPHYVHPYRTMRLGEINTIEPHSPFAFHHVPTNPTAKRAAWCLRGAMVAELGLEPYIRGGFAKQWHKLQTKEMFHGWPPVMDAVSKADRIANYSLPPEEAVQGNVPYDHYESWNSGQLCIMELAWALDKYENVNMSDIHEPAAGLEFGRSIMEAVVKYGLSVFGTFHRGAIPLAGSMFPRTHPCQLCTAWNPSGYSAHNATVMVYAHQLLIYVWPDITAMIPSVDLIRCDQMFGPTAQMGQHYWQTADTYAYRTYMNGFAVDNNHDMHALHGNIIYQQLLPSSRGRVPATVSWTNMTFAGAQSGYWSSNFGQCVLNDCIDVTLMSTIANTVHNGCVVITYDLSLFASIQAVMNSSFLASGTGVVGVWLSPLIDLNSTYANGTLFNYKAINNAVATMGYGLLMSTSSSSVAPASVIASSVSGPSKYTDTNNVTSTVASVVTGTTHLVIDSWPLIPLTMAMIATLGNATLGTKFDIGLSGGSAAVASAIDTTVGNSSILTPLAINLGAITLNETTINQKISGNASNLTPVLMHEKVSGNSTDLTPVPLVISGAPVSVAIVAVGEQTAPLWVSEFSPDQPIMVPDPQSVLTEGHNAEMHAINGNIANLSATEYGSVLAYGVYPTTYVPGGTAPLGTLVYTSPVSQQVVVSVEFVASTFTVGQPNIGVVHTYLFQYDVLNNIKNVLFITEQVTLASYNAEYYPTEAKKMIMAVGDKISIVPTLVSGVCPVSGILTLGVVVTKVDASVVGSQNVVIVGMDTQVAPFWTSGYAPGTPSIIDTNPLTNGPTSQEMHAINGNRPDISDVYTKNVQLYYSPEGENATHADGLAFITSCCEGLILRMSQSPSLIQRTATSAITEAFRCYLQEIWDGGDEEADERNTAAMDLVNSVTVFSKVKEPDQEINILPMNRAVLKAQTYDKAKSSETGMTRESNSRKVDVKQKRSVAKRISHGMASEDGTLNWDRLIKWVYLRRPHPGLLSHMFAIMKSEFIETASFFSQVEAEQDIGIYLRGSSEYCDLVWACLLCSNEGLLLNSELGHLLLSSVGISPATFSLPVDQKYIQLHNVFINFQNVPILYTANTGDEESRANKHNKTMYNQEGNDTDILCSYVRACQAKAHNREMHSMNGNVVADLKITAAPSTSMANQYDRETVAHCDSIMDAVLNVKETGNYLNHRDRLYMANSSYGAILNVPRLESFARNSTYNIISTTLPPVAMATGIVSGTMSPLVARAVKVAGVITPVTSGYPTLITPAVASNLVGISVKATAYSLSILEKFSVTGATQRISSVHPSTFYNLNDEYSQAIDSSGIEKMNAEMICAKAYLDVVRLTFLSSEAQIGNYIIGGASNNVQTDFTLNKSYVSNRALLYPPAEQYGYNVAVGAAIGATAVCGVEAIFSLHTSLNTAMAPRTIGNVTTSSIPIQLNAIVLSTFGPTRISKVLAMVASLFAPAPIFPVSLFNSEASYTHRAETIRLPGLTDIRFYLPQNARSNGNIPGSTNDANNQALQAKIAFGPCQTTNGIGTFNAAGFVGSAGGELMNYVSTNQASNCYSLTAVYASWMNSFDPITINDWRTLLSNLDACFPLLKCMKFIAQLIDSQCWLCRPLTLGGAQSVLPTVTVPLVCVRYDNTILPVGSPAFMLYDSLIKPFSRCLGGHAMAANPEERWSNDRSLTNAAWGRDDKLFEGPIDITNPVFPMFGAMTFNALACGHQLFMYCTGRNGQEINISAQQGTGLDVEIIAIAKCLDATMMGLDAGQMSKTQQLLRLCYATANNGAACAEDLAAHTLYARRYCGWAFNSPFINPNNIPAVMSMADMFFWVGKAFKETSPFPVADIINKSTYLDMGLSVGVTQLPARPATTLLQNAFLMRREMQQMLNMYTSMDASTWTDGTDMYNLDLWATKATVTTASVGCFTSVTGVNVCPNFWLYAPIINTSAGVTAPVELRAFWPRKFGNQFVFPWATAIPNNDSGLISDYAQGVSQPRASWMFTPINIRPVSIYNMGPSPASLFTLFKGRTTDKESLTGTSEKMDPTAALQKVISNTSQIVNGDTQPIGVMQTSDVVTNSGAITTGSGGDETGSGQHAENTINGL